MKTCRELDISPERQSEETEMEEDDEEDDDELIDIYARRRDSSSCELDHNGENLVKKLGSNFHISKSLKGENLVKSLRHYM